jgi:hypothetical protein
MPAGGNHCPRQKVGIILRQVSVAILTDRHPFAATKPDLTAGASGRDKEDGMRKILLATAALMSISLSAEHAFGQAKTQLTPDPSLVPPAPGTYVVNLGVRMNFYAGIIGNYNANSNTVPTPGDTTTTFKTGTIEFGEYARIYPSFDAVAANGLKYGAAAEIRQNSAGSATSSASGSGSGATLFWRNAWGYIGTDQTGTIRVGTPTNVGNLFLVGSMEGFNDGGWDGDVPGLFNGVNVPTWPVFEEGGTFNNTTKVVYLSPNFAGFDFGVNYEPNQSYSGESSFCTGGVPSPSCGTLIAGSPTQQPNRLNTVNAAVRYRATFGAFGVAAFGEYMNAGHVNDGVTPAVGNLFQPISAGSVGAQLTFGGLAVGGWVGGGNINLDTYGPLPQGANSSIAYIVGAQYTIGNVVMGFHWFDSWNPGNQTSSTVSTLGTMNEYGFAAGGTYNLVPGVAIYASYLYGKRRQGGWDFIAGAEGTGNNTVQAQGFALGTQFNW